MAVARSESVFLALLCYFMIVNLPVHPYLESSSYDDAEEHTAAIEAKGAWKMQLTQRSETTIKTIGSASRTIMSSSCTYST